MHPSPRIAPTPAPLAAFAKCAHVRASWMWLWVKSSSSSAQPGGESGASGSVFFGGASFFKTPVMRPSSSEIRFIPRKSWSRPAMVAPSTNAAPPASPTSFDARPRTLRARVVPGVTSAAFLVLTTPIFDTLGCCTWVGRATIRLPPPPPPLPRSSSTAAIRAFPIAMAPLSPKELNSRSSVRKCLFDSIASATTLPCAGVRFE
mmetsp:Transcript_57664/g.113561  ORF Transcript_57664/g.113561 Transcript_57664/m.113561 type:complete len:204 (+) Transcript_57664:584-1195(+)